MKYMLMLFGGPDQMTANTSPEWVREMGKFMMDLDMELRQTGEIVQSIGLADPTSAKTIRMQENGPVTTDGPFAEYKESLAGYWLLECNEARAVEIVQRVVTFTGGAMEIRQAMTEPPSELI